MREISLTQGKVAIVEDEDFKRLNQFKWCAVKVGLGYFNVLGDADSAYRIAEEKYFGEFTRT